METQVQLTQNGQSVLTGDLNTLGQVAALADDRVLAELFRVTPYDGATVSKGVLPYGLASSSSQALIIPNGASGTVLANPFRALVGSRTAVGSDAKKNWRDIRSAVCIGTTTLAQSVSIGANASGNPRWDLVYAAVVVDGNGASVTRKVKDPTTKAIAGASVVTTLVTSVTLGVVAGTPGASPAFPATPTDSGGTYYIPIAYVRVPDGFGAGSTVNKKDIDVIAPVTTLASAVGVSAMQPGNQHFKPTGTAITGTGTSGTNGAFAWGATANTRAALYLPPSMVGGASRIIAVDVGDASSTNWSHQNGDIVDDSIDWRNRMVKWSASAGAGSSTFASKFPWLVTSSGSNLLSPSSTYSPMAGYAASSNVPAFAQGLGETFGTSGSTDPILQLAASGGAAAATPAAGANMPTNVMASGGALWLWVDASTGALKLGVSGAPAVAALIWIDATAAYANL